MSALSWDTDAVQQRILNRVRAKASWAQILTDATVPRVTEAVGDELAALAAQDEFLTRERKWTTARNRSSLVAGAKAYNYIAHRMIGATGFVDVSSLSIAFSPNWNQFATYALGDQWVYQGILYTSLQAANSGNTPDTSPSWWQLTHTSYPSTIGIPQWTGFKSTVGLNYVSTQAINLTPSMDRVSVPIVQGVYRSTTFVAQGTPNEEFFLSDSTVDNVYYYVYINDVLWTEVDPVLNAGPTDKVFQTEDARDFSGVYFSVGDNINGAMLNSGDIVTIRYVSTSGSTGNVTSISTITQVLSTVTDVNGATVTLFCDNSSSVVGGQDYEGIESIRENAPLTLQAGNSLTYEDGLSVYLKKTFSFIGKVVVWGSYEKNIDAGLDPSTFIPSEQNLVYIAAITPGSAPLDILLNVDGSVNNSFKNQIVSATVGKKGFTDLYSFQNVDFIYINAISALTVLDSAPSLAGIVTSLQTALISGFTDVSGKVWPGFGIANRNFKDALYSSDYLPMISALPSVAHHTSYLEAITITKFSVSAGLPYSFTTALQLWPIRQGSVRVVVVDPNGISTTIATDTTGGSLVAASGFTLGSCTLTYATGAFNFQVTAGPVGFWTTPSGVWQVKIYYRSTVDDMIPKNRTQIIYMLENNITAVYQ